jgi:hypothetical protein
VRRPRFPEVTRNRVFILLAALVLGVVVAAFVFAPNPSGIGPKRLQDTLTAHHLHLAESQGEAFSNSDASGEASGEISWSTRRIGPDVALVAYWTRSSGEALVLLRTAHDITCPEVGVNCDPTRPEVVTRVQNVVLVYPRNVRAVRRDAEAAVAELRR